MQLFADCSIRFGDAPLAVDDAGRTLRYADIAAAARDWQDRLGPDRHLVLLSARNTVPHLRAYLGLAAAGHPVILMGADVFEAALPDLREKYRPDLVLAGADGPEILSRTPPAGGLHPDLAVLLSTSGSTGSPKLIRFTGAGLEYNARAIAEYLALDAAERPLAHLPFHYSFGLSVLHSHMAVGATLNLSEHSLMEKGFWQRLEGCTSLSGVPFHFQVLRQLRFERRAPASLRTLTQAGGKLPADQVAHWAGLAAEKGWKFVVMYGQTEAGPRISWLPPERTLEKPGAIGWPIPGTRMSLIDADGAAIEAADREGELVVESPSVMMGYAETRADLALGDLTGGRLVTGDMARRDAEGCYTITGRKSRFVKLQGNRVSLEAVEHRLQALGHPVACVGVDDRLFIVAEGGEADLAAIRRDAIAAFSFPPKAIELSRIEALPRSDSGKVRYAELLRQVQEGMTRDS